MTMTKAKIVQAAGNLHDLVVEPSQMITKGVFKNATPFNPANDIFNRDTSAGNDSVEKTVTKV